MNKRILTVAVAALALAACSKNETVEVAGNRAIEFGTFVDNATRAVSEITQDNGKLTDFFVFGAYGENYVTPVFTNVAVKGGVGGPWTPTQTAYWQAGENYRFAAYSNGNATIADDYVSFAAAENKLTFMNYSPNNENDLIVATAKVDNATATQGSVELNFEHLLSQVKFTFTNTDYKDYTMKISDLKINNAIKTATGTCTVETSGNTIAWQGTAETGAAYGLDEIADIAGTEGATDCFVIPQNGTDQITVTFTATLTDASNTEIAKGNFTANLGYAGDATGTTENAWTPGFRYNYTATINGSDIDDELEEKVIKFTVKAVEGWEDATDQPVTPTIVPQP